MQDWGTVLTVDAWVGLPGSGPTRTTLILAGKAVFPHWPTQEDADDGIEQVAGQCRFLREYAGSP